MPPSPTKRERNMSTPNCGNVHNNPIDGCGTTRCCGGRSALGHTGAKSSRFVWLIGCCSCTDGRLDSTGSIAAEQGMYVDDRHALGMPMVARAIIPFFVVSLVIVNALAVTSITNERDGRSLDLLLVTDLAPHEFLLGKLGGIFWVTKEMIALPIVLCGYLWWNEALSLENFGYVVGGLLVMNVFVAVLGIHCGMTYANSRAAIGVSLGTVFFLFLGVAICILMMISFSGSFSVQLAPFLTFILGGGVGLYVALGIRNPSPAILVASLLLPFCTFYAITSFLLNLTLAVFLVMAVAYSFTTAAMMIPALSEFDFAMGRNSAAEE